ncbi:glycosyltransferase family 4 protein [Nostoc sp. PCC 9305]|uniref:glycosyltransferase family 4 protein n=1 Tax=Nostoc sp. PCC 9305 TaxID=296636 RepID=UPI0039C718C9
MSELQPSLRIAIDLTPLRPGGENGGAKVLVLTLLKQFQELAPHHYFLLLTAPWNHLELAQYETNRMERLLVPDSIDTPKNNNLGLFSRLVKKIVNKINFNFNNFIGYSSLLKENKINLLFCPFSAPTYADKDIPLVAIAYDLQHLDYQFFFTAQEQQHRTKFIVELLNKSQKIICISDFTRQSFIKHFKTPPDKLAVVPISIHERLVELNESTVIEHLNSIGLAGRKYAFYPANYWPHKNHLILLTAYGIYKKQFPNSFLDLVFTGALEHEENHLKEAVDLMGLSENILFLGFLNQETLTAVWQGCQCLIFPSLYEGFGIPTLEAMKFGKPVLSSNAASLPEVGGDAVIYFDPRKPDEIASCLAKINDNQLLVEQLVKKGFQRLELFDGKEMAYQYLSIFEKEALNQKTLVQTMISGIYDDGWSAPEFHISIEPGLSGRTLEILFETPEFYPTSKATIKLRTKQRKASYNCLRGESQKVIWPLLPTGEVVTVQISPSFQPSQLNLNSDQRRLGLMVRHCRVNLVDGSSSSILALESVV